MTGRVVHFELPFDDKERAMAFYREVFGWTLQEMQELDYVGVMTGSVGPDGAPTEPGFIGGGMTSRRGPNSGTVITIDTDDVDAKLTEVTGHGGHVLQEKSPVGDIGVTAYFRDTEGNVVGLWQSATPG